MQTTSESTRSTTPGQVTCPVCGGHVITDAVARFTSRAAADHFCPRVRDAARNEAFKRVVEDLWGQQSVAVYACEQCSHGFAWPFVGGIASAMPRCPSW